MGVCVIAHHLRRQNSSGELETSRASLKGAETECIDTVVSEDEGIFHICINAWIVLKITFSDQMTRDQMTQFL